MSPCYFLLAISIWVFHSPLKFTKYEIKSSFLYSSKLLFLPYRLLMSNATLLVTHWGNLLIVLHSPPFSPPTTIPVSTTCSFFILNLSLIHPMSLSPQSSPHQFLRNYCNDLVQVPHHLVLFYAKSSCYDYTTGSVGEANKIRNMDVFYKI